MRSFFDGSGVSFGGSPRLFPVQGPRTVAYQPRPVASDQPMIGPRINRQWHQTPWKQRNFLDAALSDPSTDTSGDTSWSDVLNNLVSQAGNVLVSRNNPGALVPRPLPGQVVPAPTAAQSLGLGMSTNTLLLAAAVLGGLLIVPRLMKKH